MPLQGSQRIHLELRANGHPMGRLRILRLVQRAQLKAKSHSISGSAPGPERTPLRW